MTGPERAHEIAITRVFDAPRERVWRSWTEPERLAGWWGKRGWSTPPESVTLELRPGGAFRLTSVNDEDGTEMALDAVYREVVPPERLVFARGDELATMTLTDLGNGRTRMDFRTTIRASDAVRRRAAAGLESAFDRLAEQLSNAPSPTSGAP